MPTTERPFQSQICSEVAAGIEPVQDGRIHIEKINAPFLYALKASGPEFGAEIKHAVKRGWLELHAARERHLCAAIEDRRRQLRRLKMSGPGVPKRPGP